MRIKYSVLTLVILCCARLSLKAQENTIPKKTQTFDLDIAVGNGIYSGAVSFNRTHGFFSTKKLRLGYGLRFSGFTGSDLNYITAPAKLTAKEELIDTLTVNSPLTMGLNGSIHIEYFFTPKFKAGFNIDALGLGFGPERTTTFVSSENNGNFPIYPLAKPTSFNLLLVGDNDKGLLKSEFLVAYSISEKLWIRGGVDMTFSEYTTAMKLTNNNDRFRYKASLFFLGVSFNPFNGNE